MTFDVILEHFITGTLTFATVINCKDMDECIDHIHKEFSMFNIEQIKEVEDYVLV